MRALFTLNPFFYKYKYHFLLGISFVAAANYFAVESYFQIAKSIDVFKDILSQHNTKEPKPPYFTDLLKIAGKVLLLSLIGGAFKVAMRQTLIVASRHIEFDLKNRIYAQYQKLNLSFYKDHQVGDLMNRISEDVSLVRMYIGPGVMYTINLISLFTIVFIKMINTDKELTWYSLSSLPFLTICIYFISKTVNKRSEEVQIEQSTISSFVQDSFSGIRTIKSFLAENRFFTDYEKMASNYRDKALSLATVQAFFFPLMVFIIGISYIAILYVGGMKYIQGEIHLLSTIATFFLLVNMLIWPFTTLGWLSTVIQRAESSQKRINEFMLIKPDIVNTISHSTPIKGDLQFKDVSLTYKNTGIKALNQVSFNLKEGQTLAILGETGSGKSTLVSLITRLYEPDSGEVSIGGIPLAQLNLDQLRQAIGFVPQDSFLFSDSIANNILFGKVDASQNEIEASAKKADVHENIIHFTEGYQTLVGERGVTLSGGQKQRIAIARALIKQPSLLILDDSISAVDTKTEQAIMRQIGEENISKIIVTHRISTAKNADLILILKQGRVIESGQHHELIRQNGYYSTLYKDQLNRK